MSVEHAEQDLQGSTALYEVPGRIVNVPVYPALKSRVKQLSRCQYGRAAGSTSSTPRKVITEVSSCDERNITDCSVRSNFKQMSYRGALGPYKQRGLCCVRFLGMSKK